MAETADESSLYVRLPSAQDVEAINKDSSNKVSIVKTNKIALK